MRPLLIVLPFVLLACATAGRNGQTTTALGAPVPDRIDDQTGPDLLRAYHALPPDDPARRQLRDALVDWLDRGSDRMLRRGDSEVIARHLERLSDLLTPEDVESGDVPAAFEPVARALVARAERLGQEGKVIGALRLLRAIHPDDARVQEELALVTTWGRDARSTFPTAFQRYTGLIDQWDEASRLAPAPDVLATLAQLHVDRRDSITEGFRQGPEALLRMGPLSAQVLRLAPLDVAAVYLRHGRVGDALAHLRGLDDRGETAGQLIRALEFVQGSGARAADAAVELAEVYREARPQSATGLCRLGQRRFADDPRFLACLARIAVVDDRSDDALAYFASAIERAPTRRELYDEALAAIDELLERGLFGADATGARRLADRALRILDERASRFPQAEPPVARARIELLVGTAEMHSGNPGEAARRFEASLQAQESADALAQLGLLALRTGAAEDAVRHYRRALDLTPSTSPLDELRRATIIQSLGDSFAAAGNASQAERMWRQALEQWDRFAPQAEEPAVLAEIHTRRAILLDLLGRHNDAGGAFRAALRAAPRLRETYATALSHLVSSPEPSLELAQEIFREAQRQVTLEPQWRVYFALWVKVIAARVGAPVDTDVVEVLRDQVSENGWSGKLAAFGTGALPFDELSRAADGVGERTEALFYEGARRLAEGDAAGARQLFEQVVGLGMVGFYEHAMAQHLLRR
ncbi:MAG: hypothetical protein KF901_03860 [Myxococcales bacterium]|nr:hypothetical protein [Myxococcales bacterium]